MEEKTKPTHQELYDILERLGYPGIRADAIQHVRCDDAEHVGVRETELRALFQAHALHHAEVFRMRIEILLGRQETIERVAVAETAAEPPRVAAVPLFHSV